MVQIFTEPGAVERTRLGPDQSFTMWDQWLMHIPPALLLQDFLAMFQV